LLRVRIDRNPHLGRTVDRSGKNAGEADERGKFTPTK
jgi:hypothetical protein